MGALGTLAGASAAEPLLAQDREPLNRFPRMVHEWYVDQVRRAEQRGLARRAAVRSREDAEAYVLDARRRILDCFGPFPERTPLEPRITGVVERDGYRIEKVIFHSRPGFPVTANLYLPAATTGPVPGVVGTCGHSENGKAAEAYQSFAQGLARFGFACLIYDPIGQGERFQYVRDDGKSEVGPGVSEHLLAGNQQFLVGEFLGTWRAWDGIRALDYLLTRPEVDPALVGVTGNSGGGTMTTWLCGVETRWTMAAPSCFVTTFRRNLENELPADTEQCPPRALALELDHDDFLAAQAPKPVIILAKERDYFDVRGSEEAYARLRRLYAWFGAEDRIGLFVGPTTHGYTLENREAMYAWFLRACGRTGDGREPELVIEKDETLWCTPRGQVGFLEGTRTVVDFTRDKSATLRAARGEPSGERLERIVRESLKLPADPGTPPDYRIWRYLGARGYPARQAIAYAVECEPGIHAIVYRLTDEAWYSRPPRSEGPAILYVPDRSSDAELRGNAWLRDQCAPGTAVYTVDPRGVGESQPDTCGPNSFDSPYGSDYFYAIHGLMLDRPYPGQKTWDVLRAVDWLVSLGHSGIHLLGNGRGAIPATFAGLLHARVTRVGLRGAPASYGQIAESRRYTWPLSSFVPNVLARFDLPDCYRELTAKKGLQIVE
ncbi:MAG: hypothetical protein FJ297_04195 [Planctomycetes bacterium]|nr:hypothetical protein [Planctomycetota bacterium]